MNNGLIVVASLLVALGSFVSGQQPPTPTQAPGRGANPQPAPPPKIQVLIITGQNGHDWRSSTPSLRKVLEDTGKFEVRVTEEFRGAGPETLAPYDVVVLNYYERARPELRWGERTDTAFADYVRSGKGLVIYHFAVASFDGWGEFEKMAAGTWAPAKGYGHHSARHDFVVDIADPEHPITKGLKTNLPETSDELYANLRWGPAGSFHVLATAYDDHALYKASRTDSRTPQPLTGNGAHEPVMWTVNYGKGRVFVTVLGHDAGVVQAPTFSAIFPRGTEWAATGSVTLPIPRETAK